MSSLRLLLRILLATVAIFVCGAIARTGAGPRSFLAHPLEVNATHVASSEETPSPDDHWRHATSDVAECKAAESDFDDDDDKDPRVGFAHHGEPAARSLPAPACAHPTERCELLRDPSCFVVGTGLPRGPPV